MQNSLTNVQSMFERGKRFSV